MGPKKPEYRFTRERGFREKLYPSLPCPRTGYGGMRVVRKGVLVSVRRNEFVENNDCRTWERNLSHKGEEREFNCQEDKENKGKVSHTREVKNLNSQNLTGKKSPFRKMFPREMNN